MARLRKFVCYRDYKRPYTRYSKYKKYSFVKARPANRISRYTSGKQADYSTKLHLVTKKNINIRDNALEAARQVTVRKLDPLGKQNFFLQMRVFPHHIMRENPLASGAGADRLSTGMAHSFGKPIGIAAILKKGQAIFTVWVDKEHIAVARNALKKAAHKLPTQCSVLVEDLTVKKVHKRKVVEKAPAKKAEPKKVVETPAVKAEPKKAVVAE